jgi:hypothetical protein
MITLTADYPNFSGKRNPHPIHGVARARRKEKGTIAHFFAA